MPLIRKVSALFFNGKEKKQMKREVKVLKENEIQNIKLDIDQLEKLLLEICQNIQMPIRKSQLIKFPAEIFEYKNTKKQIDFALTGLIDQHMLIETKHFICTPELADLNRTSATPTEQAIVSFLLSGNLKESMKTDIHFNPLSNRKISPKDYFKILKMDYPALISSSPAQAYLEFLNRKIFNLNDCLYKELNEYPYTDGFITKFFANRDCRLFIKSITEYKNKIIIQVVLLNGKNYKLAHENFDILKQNLPAYFKKKIIFKSTPLAMIL